MASTRSLLPLLTASLALFTAFSAGAESAKDTADQLTREGVKPGVQNEVREEGRPGIAGGHSQAAFMAAYDADKDGRVSLDELIAVRTARLEGADKDGDGSYSETEYVAEYSARLQQQFADQGKVWEEGSEKIAGNLKQAGVRFHLLDRNRDGLLSLGEDLNSARKTFARNDTDEDGFVTAQDPKPRREDDDDSRDQTGGAAQKDKSKAAQ